MLRDVEKWRDPLFRLCRLLSPPGGSENEQIADVPAGPPVRDEGGDWQAGVRHCQQARHAVPDCFLEGDELVELGANWTGWGSVPPGESDHDW